jgi:hypothetical protein
VLSKINLAWIGALTVLPHLAFAAGGAAPSSVETGAAGGGSMIALADSLPTVSVESICRDAQAAALPESRAAAYQTCVHEESAARDQLRQSWARISAQARATCAEPPGVQVSYVELQTCLDMQSGGSLSKPMSGAGGASSLDMPAPPSPLAPKAGQKYRP